MAHRLSLPPARIVVLWGASWYGGRMDANQPPPTNEPAKQAPKRRRSDGKTTGMILLGIVAAVVGVAVAIVFVLVLVRALMGLPLMP